MNTNSTAALAGENLRIFREKLGLSQESVALYLGITHPLISMYENGSRSIPTHHLSKLADLFCVNEYDFYEVDENVKQANIAFAFRADSLTAEGLESIAHFKKIVRNYLNMKKMAALND